MRVKQTNQKEIGRIRLSDTQDLVASLVDSDKLDLRIWTDTDRYKGFTKRGVRFYLLDNNWTEFEKLIERVDRVYQEGSRGEEGNRIMRRYLRTLQ